MPKLREALFKPFTVFVVALALMAIASGYLWLVLLFASITLLSLSAFYKRPLYMLSQLSTSLLVREEKSVHDYPGAPPCTYEDVVSSTVRDFREFERLCKRLGESEPPSPRKVPRSPNKRPSSVASNLYRCGSAFSLETLDENITDPDVSPRATKGDIGVRNFDLKSFNKDAQVPLKKPTPTTPPRDRSSMRVGQDDDGAQMPWPQAHDAQGSLSTAWPTIVVNLFSCYLVFVKNWFVVIHLMITALKLKHGAILLIIKMIAWLHVLRKIMRHYLFLRIGCSHFLIVMRPDF